MNHLIRYRMRSNEGFMGKTHALSVVAVALSLAAFLPSFFYDKLLETHDIVVFVAGLMIAIGAGLFPDLDNTSSSMVNVLGPIGQILSRIMRGISRTVYSITHTSKEPSEADPHRQFWHTALAVVAGGILTSLLLSLRIPIGMIGSGFVTVTTVVLFIMLTVATNLIITVFFKKMGHKRSSLHSFLIWVAGVIVALLIIDMLPPNQSYTWVGVMVTLGWLTHILGDTLTTSGTPFFAPFKHKGKRWWNYRLPPHVKANGSAEWHVFFPLFALISIIDVIMIIARGG